MLLLGSAVGVRMKRGLTLQYARRMIYATVNSKRLFAECVDMIVVTHVRQIQ